MIIFIKVLCVYLLIILGLLFINIYRNKEPARNFTSLLYIIPSMIVFIYTLIKLKWQNKSFLRAGNEITLSVLFI